MKNKKVYLNFQGKRISLIAKKIEGINKILGLMFSQREEADALLFDFNKPTRMAIHSLFVFFSFVSVWLDDKNNVIELRKVKPFTFFVRPQKNFHKLVEIPINNKYKEKFSSIIERFK